MVSQSTQSERLTYGLLLAFGAAFLFSTKPILIKWLYSLGMQPEPLMWLRLMLAMPVYVITAYFALRQRSESLSCREILKASGIGLLGYYIASYLDLTGLQYVSAQLERLMLYAYPTLVVVIGAIFFKQKFHVRFIPMLGLTYFGLFLLYAHDLKYAVNSEQVAIGTLLILASALSFALYILFSKAAINALGSVLFTSIAMASASLAMSIHYGVVLIVEPSIQFPVMTTDLWLGSIVMAIFATVLPSFMVSEAIKHIGPARTSLTGTIGPVATTIMAVVLLNEPFGIFTLLGIVFVVIGVSRLK